MALGLDRRLPGSIHSALTRTLANPPAAPQAMGAPPSYASVPPAISDRSVQDVANNAMASGYGAREMATRGLDRAGLSRGKGHSYYGDVAQANADVQAAGQAASADMQAAAANAQARMAYDNTMRAERRSNDSLLESLRSTQAQERQARRGWQQDLYETLARGKQGLDSMDLDWTPLMSGLLRN